MKAAVDLKEPRKAYLELALQPANKYRKSVYRHGYITK